MNHPNKNSNKLRISSGFSKQILDCCKVVVSTLILCSASTVSAQLVNVPVTGFNNDIVANGVGTNSILGTTHPTIGMDGARYTFIDNTYKYTAANALPTCFMPLNNTASSMRTAGLNYTFQSYTGLNALTIDNDNTAYLTSPFAKTGTLNLSTPASYSKLYVLYESVMNVSPMSVDATVTFTDASTQVFNSNACVNWFTATLPAFKGMGRTMPTGMIQCGTTPNNFPNMFELQLTISALNQAKQVQSITFTLPANYTTGSTPDKVNYFHAMAVGGQVAPTGIETDSKTGSSVFIYPNPAAGEIILVTQDVKSTTFFVLSDLGGREVAKMKVLSTNQRIDLSSVADGIYMYKVMNENQLIHSGKLLVN